MPENFPIKPKTSNNLFGFRNSYSRFARATELLKKQNDFRFLILAEI